MSEQLQNATWNCGCLVRDPVDETLHWVIQPSWVGLCDKCRHVAPWYAEDMRDE